MARDTSSDEFMLKLKSADLKLEDPIEESSIEESVDLSSSKS